MTVALIRQFATLQYCNVDGDVCTATPTGMGTVTVTDTYGTGPDRSMTWTSCSDEHHVFPGDADPCKAASG
eukprot:CAMPEP_0180145406 /NCGR_PEP_ID=MMETSP0986-20121125/17653_1 /TAXON_ID=697907 /ORGANISM="non described non described, Strain CCMP2293" /LENGTH=70 /DNA_ID=CAMNT_0022089781 /DNA_START=18 /DNA_END=231 /DNA_ORIENTATION=-